MIGEVDDGVAICVRVIVNAQFIRVVQTIGYRRIHISRIVFLAVLAQVVELNAVVDLPRTPKNFIESLDAAMQMILSIVDGELILDTIQGEPAAGDPVRIATNQGAEITRTI